MISEEILWLKKLEKYICYTIAEIKTQQLFINLFLIGSTKCIKIIAYNILNMEQSISEAINYVRNVTKKDSPSLIFYQE